MFKYFKIVAIAVSICISGSYGIEAIDIDTMNEEPTAPEISVSPKNESTVRVMEKVENEKGNDKSSSEKLKDINDIIGKEKVVDGLNSINDKESLNEIKSDVNSTEEIKIDSEDSELSDDEKAEADGEKNSLLGDTDGIIDEAGYRQAMQDSNTQEVIIGRSFSVDTNTPIVVNGSKKITKDNEAGDVIIDFKNAYHSMENCRSLTVEAVGMKSTVGGGTALFNNTGGTVSINNAFFEGNILLKQQSATTVNLTGSQVKGISGSNIIDCNSILVNSSGLSNSASVSTVFANTVQINGSSNTNFKFNLRGTNSSFTTNGTVTAHCIMDSFVSLNGVTGQSSLTFGGSTSITGSSSVNCIDLSQGARNENIQFNINGILDITGGKTGIYKYSSTGNSSNIIMNIPGGASLNLKGFSQAGISFSSINEYILTQNGDINISSSAAGAKGINITGDMYTNYKHMQSSGKLDITTNGIGIDNYGQTVANVSGSNTVFSVYGAQGAMKVRAGEVITENVKAFNVKSANTFPMYLYSQDSQEFMLKYSGNTKEHIVGNSNNDQRWNLSQSELMFDGVTNDINVNQSSPRNVAQYIKDNRSNIDFITIGEYINLLPPEPDIPIDEELIDLIVPSIIDFGIVNINNSSILVKRKTCSYPESHSAYNSSVGRMTIMIQDNRKNDNGQYSNNWSIKLKGNSVIENGNYEYRLLDNDNLIFREKDSSGEYTYRDLSTQIEVLRGTVSDTDKTEKQYDVDEGIMVNISKEKMQNIVTGRYKTELLWSIEDTPTK